MVWISSNSSEFLLFGIKGIGDEVVSLEEDFVPLTDLLESPPIYSTVSV